MANELADLVVLTMDNPRREDPEAINEAIMAGVFAGEGTAKWVREPDRARAIALAIASANAQQGDVVVIAGKR